ncbi:MAG: hypothetical protein ACK5NN_05245 [Sphingomonadaceae bacterium]
MLDTIDITAWSATIMGLFCIASAIGALRQPGSWQTMVREIDRSPALQMIAGFMELFTGAAIYLLNPWVPADILSCIMKAIGGLMLLEAMTVMALSDIYMQLWLKNLAAIHRGWALVTLLAGLGLAAGGMLRFT